MENILKQDENIKYLLHMKILITERQLNVLNELRGMSPVSRSWGPVISGVMKKDKTRPLVIFGNEYPEQYEKFPVDCFFIENSKIPEYDENKSGMKDGKYYVFFNLPDSPGSSLNHELRHAYEDYMKISKGKQGASQSKEGILFFSGDFINFMTGKFPGYVPFLHAIQGLYYTSKLEQAAYSDSVFDGTIGVIEHIDNFVKGGYSNFRKSKFNKNQLNKMWIDLKKNVHIPIFDKFNDQESFFNWSDDYIRKRCEKVVKKLRNVAYFKQTLKKQK